MLAAEFEADVGSDPLEPVQKGFVRPPLRQGAPGTHKRLLHHILKIGMVGGKAVKHGGHGGLVACDDLIKGIEISRLRRLNQDEVIVHEAFRLSGGGHSR